MFEKLVKNLKSDLSPKGLGITILGTIGVTVITSVVRDITEKATRNALKSKLDDKDTLVELYDKDNHPIRVGLI